MMETREEVDEGNGGAAPIPSPKQLITIKPLNLQVGVFEIEGVTAYVQHKFSEKVRNEMRAKQAEGSTAQKARGPRAAKDFQKNYQQSMYQAAEGWRGIPAAAFRNAMISACRAVGYKMTHAKLAIFVEADGVDPSDGTQLVRLVQGEPHYHESPARNDSGVVDIRARAMWDAGWKAVVRIRFDADMFTLTDVANLLFRAGMQVGVGEGRPDSKNSAGLGWGLFSITTKEGE